MWRLCFILFAWIPLSATDLPSALIPPNSRVILFSGVPGDVENEQLFLEQRRTCLDALDLQTTPPSEVVILSDSPESSLPNHKFKIRQLPASRDAFLQLGASLSNSTDPMVVFMWGHGGVQGRDPVFHVKGPRITPGDLHAFAIKSPSRWILFFRGSGSFARVLHSTGREALTTENDTMLGGDPIGASLFFKLFHSNPGGEFPFLSQSWATSVNSWYEDRHLVRTEEPTIWLPQRTARRLIQESSPHSETAGDPPSPIPSGGDPNITTNQAPAEIWDRIKPVDPRQYPDSDTVMLRHEFQTTIGSNNSQVTESEVFLQILTREGEKAGDLQFSFSPPGENLTFLDCEIRHSDGTLLRLDPDAIREAPSEKVGDETGPAQKMFSFPGIAPGSILRIHLKREQKQFPLPFISMEIPLLQEAPCMDSSLSIQVPKEAAFHFAWMEWPSVDPQVQQSSYGTTYSWHFTQLPAQTREVLPSYQVAQLALSTFPDWNAMTAWYARLIRFANEVTPEIQAEADKLTRDASTDREKVARIYNFVTGLRYVSVPLGVNALRPHAAANVLQHRYGDCKDKANLFNTLLKAVRIPATLVLVPRFTQAVESVPGSPFNHAISRVQLGKETLWIDTTDDVCRFGMLPPGDPGRKVLVIAEETKNLTQLPLPQPADHLIQWETHLKCQPSQPSCSGTFHVTTKGFPDYALRSRARQMRADSSNTLLVTGDMQPSTGVFALRKQTHSPISDLDSTFSFDGEGDFVQGILTSIPHHGVLLKAPFWFPVEWTQALHRRTGAMMLHQGYPLRMEQTVEIEFPSALSPTSPLPVLQGGGTPLQWKITWEHPSANLLKAHLEVNLTSSEIPASQVDLFQSQLRSFLENLSQGIIL